MSHAGEDPPAHVQDTGSGQPVLFLHGWGASAALFAPVLAPLQEGRRLIVPDLPGFGATPPPPVAWGSREYAAWTEALLDRLQVDACDVVAHSNGGRVAIVLAAGSPHRVRRMILVDSAGIRPRHGLRHHVRVRSYKLLRRAATGRIVPEPLRRQAAARAARRGSADYRAASGTMRGTLVRLVNEDLTSLLPRIRCPVLLLWGDRDEDTPLADARTMEAAIPDAGLVVFEGAGHFSYLEQPGRFTRIADVFLRGDTA